MVSDLKYTGSCAKGNVTNVSAAAVRQSEERGTGDTHVEVDRYGHDDGSNGSPKDAEQNQVSASARVAQPRKDRTKDRGDDLERLHGTG